MEIKIINRKALYDKNIEMLIVGVFLNEKDPDNLNICSLIFGFLENRLEELKSEAMRCGFRGKFAQVFSFFLEKSNPLLVSFVGIGKREDSCLNTFRKLGSLIFKELTSKKISKAAVVFPNVDDFKEEEINASLFEGIVLTNYKFDKYLQKPKPPKGIETIYITTKNNSATSGTSAKIRRAKFICEGVVAARDLVNECSVNLNSLKFADYSRKIASSGALDLRILNEQELKKEKMNLMLAVSSATLACNPPRLIRLASISKDKEKIDVVLIGKGLTFDSGGLNLKPSSAILDMKQDMAGAASVFGIMLALSNLNLNLNVVGYLACVENAIGPSAYHPGDIVVSRKGISVEINNTDAEGRLVIADTIDYAIEKDDPRFIIDIATLTGACMVALGQKTAGIFSNNKEMADEIILSGVRSGEKLWSMPLDEDLLDQLKSSFADCRNTGERYGGAITAALFLGKFIKKPIMWAHLDIAGPAMSSKDDFYLTNGGTGFGVRTIIDFLYSLQDKTS